MFKFTDNKVQPTIQIQCECKRQFIPEEFYSCFQCQKHYCRFCTQQEIYSFFCRKCQKSEQSQSVNTVCYDCLECPFCEQVLSYSVDTQTSTPQQKNYILLCQYCLWNSKTINVQADDLKVLKGKLKKMNEVIDPKQEKFQKIVQGYKDLLGQQKKDRKQLYYQRKDNLKTALNRAQKQTLAQFEQELEEKYQETEKQREKNTPISSEVNVLRFKLDQEKNEVPGEDDAQPFINKKVSIYNYMYTPVEKSLDQELSDFSKNTLQISTNSDDRFKDPLFQPQFKDQMYPKPLNFLPKLARKCKDCNNIIIRPGADRQYKFSVFMSLYENIPTLKIVNLSILESQKQTYQVTLNVYNNTRYVLDVEILPADENLIKELNLEGIRIPQAFKHVLQNSYQQNQEKQKQLKIELTIGDRPQHEYKMGLRIKSQDTSQNSNFKVEYNLIINLGDPFQKQH